MTFSSRILASLVVLGTLAACEGMIGETPTVMARQCDLPKHQTLVGMNVGEVSFPAELPTRIIPVGNPVAASFNPNRLNVYVDEKGWIQKVTCG